MRFRKAAFILLALLNALAVFWLATAQLLPGPVSWATALGALAFLGLVPWLGVALANTQLGVLLWAGGRGPSAVVPRWVSDPPALPRSRTAIAICLRNEEMAPVEAQAARLLAALPPTAFELWLLSDTNQPALMAAEDAAIARLRARHPNAFLRRRAVNTGFKAGNVMEFLDAQGDRLDHFLCLDADSEMTPRAILRLVATMEASPRTAILQQLIVGRPTPLPFPRLFQFGMRAGMRIWSMGQAWWQGPEGPYWGHNALIRVAAFREHARLPTLPDGRAVLSHDQVEAARLHSAGWEVWCVPEEEGSMEGNPPSLPDFLARDRRWMEGNMQYWRLVGQPGLAPMARWQLIQALGLYMSAPLWVLAFLCLFALAAMGRYDGHGTAALLGALLLLWALNNAPKLAGYAQVLADGGRAARYGGRGAFLRGAGAELLFSWVLQPIRGLDQTATLLALALGRRGGWGAQHRGGRALSWGMAARQFGPHSLAGLLALLGVAGTAPWALPLALLWMGGLLLAIPFAVWTARDDWGARLAAAGIAATPEELQSASNASSAAA